MVRHAALLIVSMLAWGCASAPASPSSTDAVPSLTPDSAAESPSASPTTQPVASPPLGATPAPETPATTADPPDDADAMTDYERELLAVLREDVHVGCRPRRTELPAGAVAGVECSLDIPLVDRVAVYGFVTGDESRDADQTYEDRAVVAYLDRMDEEGVLGVPGDCLSGTPDDVPWMGPEADELGTRVYLQAEYDGRPYSIARYGCFHNEQGLANFRATCASGTYVGVLGQTTELDELTEWALRWPDPENLAFPMPGICAGLQRDTY